MTGRVGPGSLRGGSARLVPWFEGAACAGQPEPDLWFSDQPADRARARSICQGCPVRAGCFAAAVARGEAFGTWGGRNFDGRRLGRSRGIAASVTSAESESSARPARPPQLGLPVVLPSDPTQSAGAVARLLGVPVEWVLAGIDAGELPGWYDGAHWQVPLWAIAAFRSSVA